MSKIAKSKSAAAKAKAFKYLSPVLERGEQIGWRFNPGPGLRDRGVKSQVLRHEKTGAWLTLEEAQAYRDALLQGHAPKVKASAARQEPRTLNALWADYLRSPAFTAEYGVHDEALRADTRRFYKSMVKRWLDISGTELVAALDQDLISECYQEIKAATSHHTAHASLRALQAVLAFGVKRRWLASNPALGLGLSRPEGRLRLGTPEEMAALVAAADALNLSGIGDAIVAALWTAQRQADILKTDLGRQFDGEFLSYGRTHTDDTSQQKTAAQVLIPVMAPLLERIDGRRLGALAPAQDGLFWNPHTFRHRFADVRAKAAEAVPSVADFEFRDLRDTAVTRLFDAGKSELEIAQWSGHSRKSVGDILQKHYLVTNREKQRESGADFEAWRQRKGIKY
jgi:integrase